MEIFLPIAREGDILVWPEFSTIDAFQISLFLFGGFFFYLAVLFARRYIQKSDENWRKILSYAYKKKLSQEEITNLSEFFEVQGLNVRDHLDVITNKKLLHAKLHDYLLKKGDKNPESFVRIIDKLFPDGHHTTEIRNLSDIILSEACSVEADNSFFVGYIVKKADLTLTISADTANIKTLAKGNKISLYVFRNELGGYLLSGKILLVRHGSFEFLFDGKVEFKPDGQAFAEISIRFELFALDFGNGESPEETKFRASTLKLTERGMEIETDSEIPSIMFSRGEIFEARVRFGGKNIVLKGLISKQGAYDKRYNMRFVGLTENDRQCILSEISRFLSKRRSREITL